MPGDFRVYQLLRSESDYQFAFDSCIDWLTEARAACATQATRKPFDECLELTKSAEAASQSLRKAMERAAERLPTSREEKFDLAVSVAQDARSQSCPEIPAAIKSDLESWWLESVELVRDVYLSDLNGRGEGEMILERIGAVNDTRTISMAHDARLLIEWGNIVGAEMLRIDTSMNVASLHRGLLYAGVFERCGSSLRRNNLQQALGDVSMSLLGTKLPGIDTTKAVGDVIRAILDIETPNEAIGHADALVVFFESYARALELWGTHAAKWIAELERPFAWSRDA